MLDFVEKENVILRLGIHKGMEFTQEVFDNIIKNFKPITLSFLFIDTVLNSQYGTLAEIYQKDDCIYGKFIVSSLVNDILDNQVFVAISVNKKDLLINGAAITDFLYFS